MATPTAIVAYLLLFAGAAVVFLLANLTLGWFMRPRLPNREKLEVYECGEPTIGSSFVQFDLRFYVVALLFIIFDVEVAFFFTWATVFGKSTQLSADAMPVAAASADQAPGLAPQAAERLRELGLPEAGVIATAENVDPAAIRETAETVALASLVDIAVFFAVLMVGFAYVWRRGDLDWVRSVRSHQGEVVSRAPVTLEAAPRPVRTAGSILSA